MTLTLTPLTTLLIGLLAGLGSSYLFKRLTASHGPTTTRDKADLLTKDPTPNVKMDLDLLRVNQTLRPASEPKPMGIFGTS